MRTAIIQGGKITNVILTAEGWVTPEGVTAMAESEALSKGYVWEVSNEPEPQIIPSCPAYITPRQFRLWLANNNLMTAARAVINGMPAGPEKEKALIEWDYAVAIERDHPLTLLVATAIGLTSPQIDQAFREASQL